MSDQASRLNAALGGRYRIERELGEGGMATVFLADDLRHARKVALKVLRPELAAAVGVERFLAEIKTTARLQHPRILPLFDSGEADSLLFYVMPYVDGETLEGRLIRERQLPVEDAVRIATQVAEALDHAHRQGVVHRDIKPANILLRDGEVLVSDFGIAFAVGGGEGRLTATGLSLGTPRYMSPEQATGDDAVGPASDIWSLGCVLYEMLVGEAPYRGSTPQAILGRIISATPDAVTEHRRSAPPNVDAAVAKAMEKVPSDRFRSAQDFARALADSGFRHGEARAGARRLPLIAAALALYLLGIATWSALGRAGSDPAAGPAIRFVIPGVPSSSLGRIAISPDGSLIAHGGGALTLRSVADFAVPTQLRSGGEHTQPFFAPDGESIGFFAGVEQALMRTPTAGGISTPVATGTGARALGGSWGADDTITFATTEGLFRVSAQGGEVRLLRAPDRQRGELFYSWPAVLPGDESVLFTVIPEEGTSDGDGSLACLDVRSGRLAIALTGGSGGRYDGEGHLLYSAGEGTLHAVAFDPASCSARGERVALSIDGLSITRGWAADFDVSVTGTLAYMLADSRPGTLAWIDRAGREEPLAAPMRSYNYLRLSPRGDRIAVDIGAVAAAGLRDLYVLDIGRESLERLTSEPGEEFFGHWNPGGDSLYYSSNQAGGVFNIFRRAVDGTGGAELVFASRSAQMLNGITPDGRQAIVAEVRAGSDGFDLMAISLDEPPHLDTLLSTPTREYSTSHSPDGRYFAYQSNVTGQNEVYVSPSTGAARARWKVSVAGGEHPVWSFSGDTIFYRSAADSMMAATVVTTPEFTVRGVAALFQMGLTTTFGAVRGRDWDLSPANGRFLVSRRPPAEPSGIRIVLHWTQELRQAMTP